MLRFAVVLLILVHGSLSADFYVRPAGNGTGTEASPFGTIPQAVTAAGNGDTIYLLAGTYPFQVNTVPSFGGKSLSIVGEGPANTILTGGGSVFTINSMEVITISDLQLSGGFETAVLTALGGSLTARRCIFYDNGFAAVRVSGASTLVSIEDSFFQANGGALVVESSTASVTRCIFKNNLSVGQPGGAIRTTGTLNSLTIVNSDFVSNQVALFFSAGTLEIQGSTFFENEWEASPTSTIPAIQCTNNPTSLTTSGNSFCGVRGNSINCAAWTSGLSPYDSCGMCNGDLSVKNCLGECFGPVVTCPAPKVHYVALNGTGDGSSPALALPTIQDGINAAANREIVIVKEGVYTIDTPLNFGGKAVTVRSEYGEPEFAVLQGITTILQVSSGESYDSVLDGFTLRDVTQSAVRASASSGVRFKNCRFVGNYSPSGGALNLQNGFALVENCEFTSNLAEGQGGAVFLESTSVDTTAGLKAISSRFISSQSVTGGAIYVGTRCSLHLVDSVFIENQAVLQNGGGFYQGTSSRLVVEGSSFYQNQASTAGDAFFCEPTALLLGTQNNTFCGINGNDVSCSPYVAPGVVEPDACQVCGGSNASQDCSGTCWGFKVTDGQGGCCLNREKDCNGVCNGTSVVDVNGVCCLAAAVDACGICDGLNQCLACDPPCSANGECVQLVENESYCNCTGGYEGNTCESFSCSRTCSNGGVCIGPDTCNCTFTGFLGDYCDSVSCGDLVCTNGGSCTGPNTCNCTEGYSGDTCEDFECDPLCEHGTCVGANICSCTGSGYTGPTCSVPSCNPQCQNGGVCEAPNQCDCTGTGFSGPVCSSASGTEFESVAHATAPELLMGAITMVALYVVA